MVFYKCLHTSTINLSPSLMSSILKWHSLCKKNPFMIKTKLDRVAFSKERKKATPIQVYFPLPNKKRKGFSLIEVLISFLIITFLILTTAQLTLYSLQVKRRSDCSLNAAELASAKLEYFKSLPYESDELGSGPQSEVIEGSSSPETFRREWDIQSVSLSMKKIEVACYSANFMEKKAHLILFLSRDLGF